MYPLHKDLQNEMENTYLILLSTEIYFLIVECALAPDINLEGRLIANNGSQVLQLICSTNIAVQLCTVEFLKDKKTHDNLRYFYDNCFYTERICSPTVCTCSGDCKSFTLNVTSTHGTKNNIYSCASRIESEGVIYSANISIIQDGNGGSTIFQKIVVPSNIVNPPQQATTLFPEISTVELFSAPWIIFGTSFGLLFVVIVLYVIYKKKCCSTCYTKLERKKSSSPIHDHDDLGESERKQSSSSIHDHDDLEESAGFQQYMTRFKAPRTWKQASPTLECTKWQETVKHVKYSRNKEKRPTISTISTISTNSGSMHSLDDIIFVHRKSSRNDSYCSDA